MSDPTIDDLMNPPTTEEIKESIYKTLAQLDVKTAGWKPGGIVRTLIAIFSACLAVGYKLVSLIAKGGFLDTSEGEWLTLLAHNQYEVDRLPASFASGQATVTNTGGGEFIFYPGDLIMVAPNSGKLYVNTTEFALHSHSSLTTDIIAKEAGAASSALVGDVNSLVTPFIGVSATNTTNMLGVDGESDPALRRRCRDKPFSLSVFGPPGAYRYWAKMAVRADGSRIDVNRVRVLPAIGDGSVQVVVATANGAVSSQEDLVDIYTMTHGMAAPYGTTTDIINATAVPIDVTCEIWIYDSSNLNEASLTTLIKAALPVFFQEEPIGGNSESASGGGVIYLQAIANAIFGADPKRGIYRVDMSSPDANIPLTESQIAIFHDLHLTAVHIAPSRVE